MRVAPEDTVDRQRPSTSPGVPSTRSYPLQRLVSGNDECLSASEATYEGQHIASVLVPSLAEVTTVEKASGHVIGPMLTAV